MNKVPIIGMESQDLNLRQPDGIGKKYSVVYFFGCNNNCIFCYQQNTTANNKPRNISGLVKLSDIKDFIKKEIGKGHAIKITGGEPLLYPNAVKELLRFIKKEKGFVALDTNGTKPDIVNEIIEYLDIIGVDIKSPPDKIEFYTGREKSLSYDLPLQTLKNSKNFPCKVEFKRVMFKVSSIEDLEHFYPFASHAYWILKKARPFPEKRVQRLKKSQRSWIEPIEKDILLSIMNEFVTKHPNLKKKIVSIVGSTRNLNNYYYPG